MSITSDVRSYADAAVEQGKQVIDQAQARLTGVAGDVGAAEVVDKVQDRAQDLAARATAAYVDFSHRGEQFYERVSALPIVGSVSTAVEPYVAQLNDYRVAFTGKVEGLYADLKQNDQVAKVLDTAEQAAGLVLGTVNEKVVKPVRSLVEHAPIGPPTRSATPKPAAKATSEAKATPAKSAQRKPSAQKTTPAKRTATRRTQTTA